MQNEEVINMKGLESVIDGWFAYAESLADGIVKNNTIALADDAISLYVSLGGRNRWNGIEMDLKTKIGLNLREKRKENKYDQHEVALILGLGQSTVFKVERGFYYPRIEHLQKLCELYGCTASDLLGF